MPRLEGRNALVTGASSGIGRAVALAFAQEGAQVAVHHKGPEDRESAERLAEEMVAQKGGSQPLLIAADVTKPAEVEAAVGQVLEEWGRIDILVNCAGILTQSLLVDMPLAMWEETIATDLTSTFLFCRLVVPDMIRRRRGRIINVASQLGQIGGVELTHYSAAKAGVIGFTKALAREVSAYQVTVNCIAPGPIETPLLDGISAEWKRAKQAELPLGRFGSPDEVAPTAVFLAAEPDGNLYTGQTLGPNSGDVML